MNKRALLLIPAIVASLTGCESLADEPPVNAVMVDPTPAAMDEITSVVSKALNGRSVKITSDSLQSTNRLIIERAAMMQERIPMEPGSAGMPNHFYLMKSGKSCMLRHDQTGEIYPLRSVKCAPMEQP